MTFLGVALSRMTLGVCKPPLADFGGREKREVFICHHSMMQRPRGRKGGRRPKLSLEQQQLAADMAHGGIPITTIATTLGCSRHTVYKALKPAGVDA